MQYTVIGNIKHDGTRYTAGQSIQMEESQAKSLIEAGELKAVAQEVEAPKTEKEVKKSKAPEAPKTGDEMPKANVSRAKMAEYATAHGVEFSEEATRDEIFALIQANAEKGASEEPATPGANDESSKGDDESNEGSEEGSDESKE